MKADNIKINKGNPLLMGASVVENGINFSVSAEIDDKCEVILYEKNNIEETLRIPFVSDHSIGNIFSMRVEGIDYKKYDYNFSINGEIVTDLYARALVGKKEWGKIPKNIRGIIVKDEFDWDGDTPLKISFEDTIIYRLHVRGFTKHSSSKAKHKGTYLGIVDKIPYLKELGVTMIELMPAYEFNEIIENIATSMKGNFNIESPVLNYWGYTYGYTFAPKASYAYTDKLGGEIEEFKYMVRELHRNGIEISMEFFFAQNTNPRLVLDTLNYWILEYHIDGIHVNCDNYVMKMIKTDNLLGQTKIFVYNCENNEDYYSSLNQFDKEKNYYGQIYRTRNIAQFNDDFMVSARKFVKGDEDMLNSISHKIKSNPIGNAVVNYIANHNTFTLYDTVSYDRKYNEPNGENNRDGAVYNYSWNCGIEGDTKKRKINTLRKCQIKNGLAIVLLSQGVPMIYAGDEMCNSQKGNNNPYCLDNEISWTNWNTNAMAKEIFEFTKKLINFRKEHRILHMPKEMRMMDYKSYGSPDMSFHGSKAWYTDFSHFNRHFSVMYCGKYALCQGKKEESDILVAYNMYWENVEFGIPVARDNKKWNVVFSTDSCFMKQNDDIGRILEVPKRSIVVLMTK